MTGRHVVRPASHGTRVSVRPVVRVSVGVLVFCAPAAASGSLLGADPSPSPSPEVVENAAGARDTLSLVDLGGVTAAIYTLVAAEGDLTREQSWRRRPAASGSQGRNSPPATSTPTARPTASRSTTWATRVRLFVFLSNGDDGMRRSASPGRRAKGAFAWSRAKLAVGDINSDGKDDGSSSTTAAAAEPSCSASSRRGAPSDVGRLARQALRRADGPARRRRRRPATGAPTRSCSPAARPRALVFRSGCQRRSRQLRKEDRLAGPLSSRRQACGGRCRFGRRLRRDLPARQRRRPRSMCSCLQADTSVVRRPGDVVAFGCR